MCFNKTLWIYSVMVSMFLWLHAGDLFVTLRTGRPPANQHISLIGLHWTSYQPQLERIKFDRSQMVTGAPFCKVMLKQLETNCCFSWNNFSRCNTSKRGPLWDRLSSAWQQHSEVVDRSKSSCTTNAAHEMARLVQVQPRYQPMAISWYPWTFFAAYYIQPILLHAGAAWPVVKSEVLQADYSGRETMNVNLNIHSVKWCMRWICFGETPVDHEYCSGLGPCGQANNQQSNFTCDGLHARFSGLWASKTKPVAVHPGSS